MKKKSLVGWVYNKHLKDAGEKKWHACGDYFFEIPWIWGHKGNPIDKTLEVIDKNMTKVRITIEEVE